MSSYYDGLVFCHRDVCLCLDDSYEQNIYDKRQEIKSMVLSML